MWCDISRNPSMCVFSKVKLGIEKIAHAGRFVTFFEVGVRPHEGVRSHHESVRSYATYGSPVTTGSRVLHVRPCIVARVR